MAGLPLAIFPGFTAYGLVSDAAKELAVTFNAEGVEALQTIPEEMVAWADIGTRTTQATFEAKIPIRLTSLLGFEPFEGERHYHNLGSAAVTVKVSPFALNLQWPVQIDQSGIPLLRDALGISGVANDVVQQARAMKADLVASVVAAGFSSVTLGVTAKALTIPQPGYASGLPLFSDGTITHSHYSNPLDKNSTTFNNWFYNVGKITDTGVFGTVLTKMSQVPHPSKLNMTMGLGVTDIVGPPHMLIPFLQLATQTLSLQTTTISATNLAAATTNIYNPAVLTQVNASGALPWRFHIAPQLNAHPYVVAHPTDHFWLAISRARTSGAWCEIAAPTKEFTPRVTLLGDGSEEAIKSKQVRLLGDLDAGAAAGLPHFVSMWCESNIAS
jgi:hypothetical protein